MFALLAASLIWAFSFGLIKTQLAGIPPDLVAVLRLALSALLFAPFFRAARIGPRPLGLLVCCGAVQYGLMYLAYLASFRYLKASEVALWTIFTPIYVVLFADVLARTFRGRNLLAAALSVLAAGLVVRGSAGQDLMGVGLVQVSNLCFAAGQVWYRRLVPPHTDIRDREIFAALYLGAALLAAVPTALHAGTLTALAALTPTQHVTILYLGLIPSGLGFFLWNVGVRRTSEGAAGVMNNAKVPLAILVSWGIFEPLPTLENLARTLAAVALIFGGLRLTETRRARESGAAQD